MAGGRVGAAVVAALAATALAQDIITEQPFIPCPFNAATYPGEAKILVADATWCLERPAATEAIPVCILSPSCRLITRLVKTADGTIVVDNGIHAIGSLKDFPSTAALNIRNCDGQFTTKDISFASSKLQNLSFSNCNVGPLITITKAQVSWPQQLTILRIDNAIVNSNLLLPSTLVELRLRQVSSSLTRFGRDEVDFSGLSELTNLRILDLSDNSMTSFTNVNLTYLQRISLDHNPRLTTMANVHFSRKLVRFSAINTSLSDVRVTDTTHDALSILPTRGAWTRLDGSEEGFAVPNLTYGVLSDAQCDLNHGAKRYLGVSSVCVVQAIPNKLDESSDMAQSVVGALTVVVVVLASIVLWQRWHQAKAAKPPSKDTWELHM